MSKLTCTLNCIISFFLDYCSIHDFLTKRIIGRGREFGGLYILETEELKFVPCYEVLNPFELHCHLGHPSLFLLKKLYHQFSRLLSLNRESCQYAKLHRVHLSPRVNNQAYTPFELVHSDVWSPCLVESPIRFRYFVTFVDDHS